MGMAPVRGGHPVWRYHNPNQKGASVMKKILSLFLALSLLVMLCACGGTGD